LTSDFPEKKENLFLPGSEQDWQKIKDHQEDSKAGHPGFPSADNEKLCGDVIA